MDDALRRVLFAEIYDKLRNMADIYENRAKSLRAIPATPWSVIPSDQLMEKVEKTKRFGSAELGILILRLSRILRELEACEREG